jgi:hypothetical protein
MNMQQLSLFDPDIHLTANSIENIFADSYRNLKLGQENPVFHVEFYPFVGINHTIRIRNKQLIVRLSDLFEDASRQVIKAISLILLAKLYRRRMHPHAIAVYREYIESIPMKNRATRSRRQRGHKFLGNPKGQYHNLSAIYEQLNGSYFRNELTGIKLGWSPRKSRRILGHFDPSHHSITISRWFDREKVPEFVVSYILYHELLHARFSTSSNFDLKNKHGKNFKVEEKKFPWYIKANEWLKHNL